MPSAHTSRTERVPRPLLRFALSFLGGLAVFQWLFLEFALDSAAMRDYLRFNAWISNQLLSLLGRKVTQYETQLVMDDVSVDLVPACAGLQPIAIYWIAVLALPASWRLRARAAALGGLTLFVINQARIVSLALIGARDAQLAEAGHFYVWPMIFIVSAICLWVSWARATVVAPP